MEYDMKTDYRPIPPGERFEKTVTAEKFHCITMERPKHTEGVIFDRLGRMLYASGYEGKVFRLDMNTLERELVWFDPDLKPVSVKIHRDGRLFISCLGTPKKDGRIVVTSPDGEWERDLAIGFPVDDIVFDHEGGLYFTHFVGTVYNPCGGIYYISPDLEHMKCFIPNLASPNGIALSTDESIMWVTEFTGGRLLRIPINSVSYGAVVYHFTGFYGPDSCSVDADDNLYVALYESGRVMVFNKDGYPFGQILMPGRDEGRNLLSTHPMVRPGTKELYISCADDITDEGSWIMKAPAFGMGNEKAFHLT